VRIGIAEFSPVDGDTVANRERAVHFIEEGAKRGVKLLVFPELSDVGYNLRLIQGMEVAAPNPFIDAIANSAAGYGVGVLVGALEKEDGRLYNTAVAIGEGGRVVGRYRKMHLCSLPPFDEPSFFAPGNAVSVVDIGGLKVGMSICFDIRFPELYRLIAAEGAHVAVCLAAFPLVRIEEMIICARARAIENQYFVLCANRIGRSGGVEFGGNSMVIGPDGRVITSFEREDGILVAEIDPLEVGESRRKRPIFLARRVDIYGR